ncbi:hypothetical protein C2G38_2222207 [Gigaspora rosea]|uniref:Uncharacterized protein n=1 Tax=Gigaspora rosea TaxID=44941 RepID=A0A397UB23_9GLOM|nr:hypothetical protein C2G38_2222207 [Gigaspora rosea]
MESDLNSFTKKNYNLKTSITKEFSDLDINKYNKTWFNKNSDLNTVINKNKDLKEIAFFTKKLCTNQIIYNMLPVEYPAISEDSIANIFNIDSWDNYWITI